MKGTTMRWRRFFWTIGLCAAALILMARLVFDLREAEKRAAAEAETVRALNEEGLRRRKIYDDLKKAGAEVAWLRRSSAARVRFFLPLSERKRIDPQTIELLSQADELEQLAICNCDLDWSALSKLRRLPNLRFLVIGWNNMRDEDLAFLKRLTQLRRLQINNTDEITDEGLKHMSGLTNLEYLYLQGTKITDAGMEHLKRLRSLQHLDVRHTGVTEDGEQFIRKWLPELTVLY